MTAIFTSSYESRRPLPRHDVQFPIGVARFLDGQTSRGRNVFDCAVPGGNFKERGS